MTKVKTLTAISAVLFFLFASASNALAYGGGTGFPPGYYDNPHKKNKLVCEFIVKELPFNREIIVPKCKVVQEMVMPTKGKSLQERLSDFGKKLTNGSK